jgi:hypothetical protein
MLVEGCHIFCYFLTLLGFPSKFIFEAFYNIQDASIGIATGWTAGVGFPAEQKIFLYSTAPRPALGPTQPTLFPGVKGWGRELTTNLHLVPR